MPRDASGQLVEREFLTLPVWDQFDAAMAEAVARGVERCLPEPWAFARVARHECGGQKRYVAFFDRKGREFALIPGGEITLGYDAARPAPPAGLLDNWYEEAREWAQHYPEWEGITWERYLSDIMSPLRRVQIAPFLVAVRGEPKSHATGTGERNAIAAEGFLLPTADQWEFACSAGSRSAWHWGDDPTGGPPQMNAFGLVITQNTYHKEVLDVRDHFRGGDGGQREHGGCCELESFVPFSSWFRARGVNATQEDWWELTFYRRVYPLPDEVLG
jgi:formylglycine-generating enzyme required for sulfatase activity